MFGVTSWWIVRYMGEGTVKWGECGWLVPACGYDFFLTLASTQHAILKLTCEPQLTVRQTEADPAIYEEGYLRIRTVHILFDPPAR